ncbi:16S rRNA (guanine(966)-N(2))-methyltransferase RsmD [Anaeroselena agilis]|uniref:16S rRNA (Guanine(966)-N(2))-methyltransferase RsmD n=1 Tax=Anaeroselena agilis TaxID=3063788 RepID=A0ABU3NWN7_9FIRM|nr:16S rRNA (guanine(966)-N(2))-methyltransferase RsmD [Selenomonadales bacterium 4137-cl]
MRIITGTAKGLKLKAPRGRDVRPTSDRVKESLFAILADRIRGAAVADFFAGTGNLGLEALSRGAAAAVFVDASPASNALIRDNADRARLAEKAELLRKDALAAAGHFARSGRTFDIIFCDPPYNKGLVAAILEKIDAGKLLKPGGVVIIEHSRHEPLPAGLVNLTISRTERYGETLLTFLEHTT